MKNIYDDEMFFKEYAKMERSLQGLEGAGEWHQFKEMLPNFQDKTVLDLGCGYGWHSRYASERGAKLVVGIDQSEKMIQTAKEKNNLQNIDYRICNLLEYDYPKDAFDCVISNLVLHYIEDLNQVYKNVYRTLKKDGIFVLNIEHPSFTAGINQQWIEENGKLLYWPIDNYFYSGKRTTYFLGVEVKKYHHTLTEIVQGLIECGFAIEQIQEATPPLHMMNMPYMLDEMRRPMMLMVKVRK